MMSLSDRLKRLKKLRLLLVRDLEDWIGRLSAEGRKTPMDSLTTDLLTTVSALSYYGKHAAGALKRRRIRTPMLHWGAASYVSREPYGVVLVVSPWNFPLQLSLIPVAAALAAGNAVVLKPSEKLPAINGHMANLFAEAGFPPGVLQLVEGGKETVEALIDAVPDKIFFTGGTETGKAVLARAAKQLIPCDLELGGKDPMLVCADADVTRAAEAAVWGAFMHSGQVCVSVERVYVHESIYRAFVDEAVRLTRQLRQRAEGWADMAGMQTAEGWHGVKRQLDDALAKGAVIEAGGLPPDAVPPLFPPTILTGVTANMRLMEEETFGPLLPIQPFRTEEEAVTLANAGSFGLNASIFTADRKRGLTLAAELRTGGVALNDVIVNIANMNLPFGGTKNSGFGRTHGIEGLLAFTQSKSVMVKRAAKRKRRHWFPYGEDDYQALKKAVKWLYGAKNGN